MGIKLIGTGLEFSRTVIKAVIMVPNEFGDLARQNAYSCVLND